MACLEITNTNTNTNRTDTITDLLKRIEKMQKDAILLMLSVIVILVL